jgi:signal transduction histidine kinase
MTQKDRLFLLRPTSLGVKIFLAFWVAMTIAGFALLALETVRAERLTKRWRGVTSDAFAFYATSITKDHEDEATYRAREFLTDLYKRTGIRAWLFDEKEREVSGYAARELAAQSKWLLSQMQALRQKSRGSISTEFIPLGQITLAAHTATASNGKRYTLIGILPAARYGPWEALPQTQLLRLISILAVAALVSWLLSRQITAPVEMLRGATLRLSQGDLSARASERLGNQRDELAQLARDFDRMAERIETLMREQEHLIGAQRRLVRDVSHELRSPLARLGVALELTRDAMQAQSLPESQMHAVEAPLERIEREAGRLGEMLDRLLVLARLDSGVQAPEATIVDLSALLRAVVADADFEARAAHRTVNLLNCDPCVTKGTHDLLRSALENVVRNALHYTPESGTVEVKLRRAENWAIIEVCDGGPGVPEEELPQIFRPFYRASNSRPRQKSGTGLGLAITERALALHGGSIRATNILTGGLCIEIRLPLFLQQTSGV